MTVIMTQNYPEAAMPVNGSNVNSRGKEKCANFNCLVEYFERIKALNLLMCLKKSRSL